MPVQAREVWFHRSEDAKALHRQRREMQGRSHVSPNSVLLAAMGTRWLPRCYDAVYAMAEKAFGQARAVCFYEEYDRCFKPYDALGIMRNHAYMRALAEGWEYICYVDCDVQPPEDTLIRLMARMVPIIGPRLRYSGGQQPPNVANANVAENQGLVIVDSISLSMMLFKSSVFLPWALIPFWQDAIGADEEYHFRRLALVGHHPFIDTDLTVECKEPPHFPLDKRPALNQLWVPR